MWVALLLGLTSMLVSGFGTIIGFGGGVFMVPIMVILFGIKIKYAIGVVTLALFPAALISTVHNWHEKLVDYVVGTWLEIPTILGTVLGAWLVSRFSPFWLEIVFSVFLLYVSGRMLPKPGAEAPPNRFVMWLNGIGPVLRREHQGSCYAVGTGAAILFGGISGVMAGLFGIGGGFLKTPIMIRIFRMPAKVAVATALFMIVFTSATSICSHWALGHVELGQGIPVVVGFVLGAILGNAMKGRLADHHTEQYIAVGLLLAATATFAHAMMQ